MFLRASPPPLDAILALTKDFDRRAMLAIFRCRISELPQQQQDAPTDAPTAQPTLQPVLAAAEPVMEWRWDMAARRVMAEAK